MLTNNYKYHAEEYRANRVREEAKHALIKEAKAAAAKNHGIIPNALLVRLGQILIDMGLRLQPEEIKEQLEAAFRTEQDAALHMS